MAGYSIGKITRQLRTLRFSLTALGSKLEDTLTWQAKKRRVLNEDTDGDEYNSRPRKTRKVGKKGGRKACQGGQRQTLRTERRRDMGEIIKYFVREASAVGASRTLMSKAEAALRVYHSVLVSCRVDASESEGGGRVASLREMTSRRLGWNIENSINQILEDEYKLSDLEWEKSQAQVEDRAVELCEEYYCRAPESCRRWMLSEHATVLAVMEFNENKDTPIKFWVIRAFLDVCLISNALDEATHISTALLLTGFKSGQCQSSVLDIAHTLPAEMQDAFYETLGEIVGSSTIEEKYFFSEFFSASSARLCGAEDVVRLWGVQSGIVDDAAKGQSRMLVDRMAMQLEREVGLGMDRVVIDGTEEDIRAAWGCLSRTLGAIKRIDTQEKLVRYVSVLRGVRLPTRIESESTRIEQPGERICLARQVAKAETRQESISMQFKSTKPRGPRGKVKHTVGHVSKESCDRDEIDLIG